MRHFYSLALAFALWLICAPFSKVQADDPVNYFTLLTDAEGAAVSSDQAYGYALRVDKKGTETVRPNDDNVYFYVTTSFL